MSALLLLAPVFMLFEVGQLYLSERYLGIKQIARNADPSEDDIKAAVPNLCRCGVYPRLVRAIQRAGRVMRRVETISAAPAPGITPQDAAQAVPALKAE